MPLKFEGTETCLVDSKDFDVPNIHHSFVIVRSCPMNLAVRDLLCAMGLYIVFTKNKVHESAEKHLRKNGINKEMQKQGLHLLMALWSEHFLAEDFVAILVDLNGMQRKNVLEDWCCSS